MGRIRKLDIGVRDPEASNSGRLTTLNPEGTRGGHSVLEPSDSWVLGAGAT